MSSDDSLSHMENIHKGSKEKVSKNVTPKRSLSQIQHEHDNALVVLEKQRSSLKKSLSCVEQLDLLVNVLSYKMYESENQYRKDMEHLQAQRQQLLSRQEIKEDQLALALAELDKKINEHQNSHEAIMTSLLNQKEELQRETLGKVKQMDLTYQSIKEQQETMIAELETIMEDASPSEAELCTDKINELKIKFDSDGPELNRLATIGWRELNSEEKLAALLEQRGVKVTKSGRMITNSGHSFTFEEAENAGYFKGINQSFQTLLENVRNLQAKKNEFSTMSEDSSEASVFSRMSSEDVHYLKQVLGKPLTLALAEIVAKQPRDPIHYLGHWLFKYRYNQEIDMLDKERTQELTEERERVAKEKWHKVLQEEAKNVVLDMITKAEEEALQNEMAKELERMLREQEAEEEAVAATEIEI